MRVVVTGSTGNMGTAVTKALAGETGVEVVGLARRAADVPPPYEFHQVDVATDDLASHFAGADAVVHLAWIFQPTHRPDITWTVNVGGSERVLRAAAEAGVGTVLYASSVGAYSPGPGQVVDETWPTHSLPTAAYGREKSYVERLVDRFSAERPETRVIRFRPGFVFQAASASQQRRLFAGPLLPAQLLLGRRLPVLPWPAGLRFQAVHADDLADAYRRALMSDVSGAFNLASDPIIDGEGVASLLGAKVVTVSPALVRAAVAVGWHARAIPAEPALFDLVLSLPEMRIDRLQHELGWRPSWSSLDALHEALKGMAGGTGGPTAPLAPDSVAGRLHEVATGAGERP
jgi:nucleoside-diphosphate-sugar epimerase